MKVREYSQEVVAVRERTKHHLIDWTWKNKLAGRHGRRDDHKMKGSVQDLRAIDDSNAGDVGGGVRLAF